MNQIKTKIGAAIGIIAVFVSMLVIMSPRVAVADDLSDKEAALKKQIAENQSAANIKRTEADTLANKIAILDGQIKTASDNLALTNLQITKTERDIDRQNKELDRQRAILKDNLRMIYRQGNISPIEVIASSKNLSDFVAQQQYLGAIKKKVDDNMTAIDLIKKDLDAKKGELNGLALQQKGQLDNISAQKSEKDNLLAKTRGEESAYKKIVADSNKQLEGIYAERQKRDAASGVGISTGGTGGYPFANGPIDVPDPWGYLTRECTSYAAWYRYSIGKPVGRYGNAGSWPGQNIAPQRNDVVVYPYSATSPYGHVAIVEKVNSNGTIDLSEFNWRPYQYSYRSNVPISGLKFIR